MLDADIERRRAQELGVNNSQLSAISGIPAPKLSMFLSGTQGLSNREITVLRATLSDLEELVAVAKPFPLSFRNTHIILELIASIKRGELSRSQP
jgi:hypothetical protein